MRWLGWGKRFRRKTQTRPLPGTRIACSGEIMRLSIARLGTSGRDARATQFGGQRPGLTRLNRPEARSAGVYHPPAGCFIPPLLDASDAEVPDPLVLFLDPDRDHPIVPTTPGTRHSRSACAKVPAGPTRCFRMGDRFDEGIPLD